QSDGPQSATVTNAQPKLCAAIRGNGPLISAHWPALARVVANYGLIDAAAGGSSASITMFLYESILHNPLVYDCKDHSCTDLEVKARVALLLKSMLGYIQVIGKTKEIIAIRNLYQIQQMMHDQDVDQMFDKAVLDENLDDVQAAKVTEAF